MSEKKYPESRLAESASGINYRGAKETQAVPDAGETLRKTEAVPDAGETLRKTEAVPDAGETLRKTEAVPDAGETLRKTEAVPDAGETLRKTEAVPDAGETLRKTEAGPDAGGTPKRIGDRDVFSPLRDVRVMVNAGILSAIAIVLGLFKIPVTQLIEIRFAVLPLAIAAYMFGPAVGGAVGFVSDIGGYLLRPTGPFFPGFTITSVIAGVIFGCILYKRRPAILRIFAAQIVYTLICGIFMNSLWLSMLYGNGFIPVLTARIVKELVMIPANTLMLAAVLQPVKKLRLGKAEQ